MHNLLYIFCLKVTSNNVKKIQKAQYKILSVFLLLALYQHIETKVIWKYKCSKEIIPP